MKQSPLGCTEQGLVSKAIDRTYTGGWPFLRDDQRAESQAGHATDGQREPRQRPSHPRVGTLVAGNTSAGEGTGGNSWETEQNTLHQQWRGLASRQAGITGTYSVLLGSFL